MALDRNTPLGITQLYNPATNSTEVSFCYLEDSDIEYFVLEYWDPNSRKWVAYDGKQGVIKRGVGGAYIADGQTTTGSGGSGTPGLPGKDGKDGEDGKSAYDLAVEAGFVGTLEAWLASLKGEKGDPGDGGTSSGVALGETSATAYRGDRGKIAYDHSQLTNSNPHNVTKAHVGLGNVNNTADLDKPISTATQAALDLKQDIEPEDIWGAL